jgi:hypothetical protein
MATLYRVENDNHVGPYQDSDRTPIQRRMSDAHSYSVFHPAPMSNGYWMRRAEKCAFNSMQDLFSWFGGYLPGLVASGYHVVKVSGVVNYDDGYQVVYLPD